VNILTGITSILGSGSLHRSRTEPGSLALGGSDRDSPVPCSTKPANTSAYKNVVYHSTCCVSGRMLDDNSSDAQNPVVEPLHRKAVPNFSFVPSAAQDSPPSFSNRPLDEGTQHVSVRSTLNTGSTSVSKSGYKQEHFLCFVFKIYRKRKY